MQAHIALVSEDYPSECIRFRSILDTTHSRFRVRAAKTTVDQEDEPASGGQYSDVSLQLKPPNKRVGASPTPSHSGGNSSVPVIRPSAEPAGCEVDTERNELPPSRQRDVLDDMVDEVKAVKHLVCAPAVLCGHNSTDINMTIAVRSVGGGKRLCRSWSRLAYNVGFRNRSAQ